MRTPGRLYHVVAVIAVIAAIVVITRDGSYQGYLDLRGCPSMLFVRLLRSDASMIHIYCLTLVCRAQPMKCTGGQQYNTLELMRSKCSSDSSIDVERKSGQTPEPLLAGLLTFRPPTALSDVRQMMSASCIPTGMSCSFTSSTSGALARGSVVVWWSLSVQSG